MYTTYPYYKHQLLKPLWVVVLLASLTGCAGMANSSFFHSAGDIRKKMPQSENNKLPTSSDIHTAYLQQIQAQFSVNAAGEAPNPYALRLQWLNTVNDSKLTSLVNQALTDNIQVQLAKQQLAIAEATAQTDSVSKKPVASITADANYGSVLDPLDSASDGYTLRANIGWELDLWGKLRAGKLASVHDVQAVSLQLKATQLSVAAQTAKAYIAAIVAKQHLSIAQSYVTNVQKTADVTAAFKKEGFASSEEVSLVDIDLANAHKQQHAAEAAVARSVRQLNIWRGKYPTLAVALADSIPSFAKPSAVVSSNLLEQRPDVAAAMQTVNSAFLRSQQAKLSRLPSFNLGGSIGAAPVSDLSRLFDPKYILWNVVGGLTVPLLANSQLTIQSDIQAANAQATLASFKATALNAFAEVEAVKATIRQLQQDEPYVYKALKAAQLSEKIAMARFKEGQLDMVELLQAKRTLLNQQLAVANQQAAMQSAIIDWYVGMGGDVYTATEQVDIPAGSTSQEATSDNGWQLIKQQLGNMFGL